MPAINQPGSPEKKQESRDAQKVLRLLDKELRQLGFKRTKPSFFIRSGKYVLEFVHVHKYSFGPAFRVEFGIRVRSDNFSAAHLNGPSSSGRVRAEPSSRPRDDFTYAPDEATWAECAAAMYHYVSQEGVPWFASVSDVGILISPNSPLAKSDIAALKRELEQPASVQLSEATRLALNPS